MADISQQITQLEASIAALEAQQALLGPAVVEAALAPLRQQLAALKSSASQAPGAVRLEGERKQVTILFADNSGFTAMSETTDPEQIRSLMNACFDHLVPAIHKYGGVVDKFIGDEIMALFGAPVAHENDPERALRAALEMAGRLEEFNQRRGTDLGLHFGVNTGTVIAGGIGSSTQQQYSVMGDAVNIASRLEDVSDRGEIFVGPDTYRLTAPLFDFEALPPVQLKGRAEAVPIYRLVQAKSQPGRVRGLAGLESPMVGRGAELQALLKRSAAAQTGQGGAVVITGEPGLGKTRLIAEWKAAAGKLRWIEGRCLSYGQNLAYHLLVDLLHSAIEVPASAGEEETRQALERLCAGLFGETAIDTYPYLGHLLALHLDGAALERVRLLDPQALQGQYRAALRRLLLALAARQPAALVFEDIHWADPSSSELLTWLLPLHSEAALLFCFITRPEQDTPGWRIVTGLREAPNQEQFTEIALQPLTEDDSRQLVANLLEIEALPESIRTTILKKAEGNPFFVEEVIRMLIDRGVIVRNAAGSWQAVKEIENVEIPDTLQALLLARIDRLPSEVRHVLRVASVIGRQFSVPVLEEVLRRYRRE